MPIYEFYCAACHTLFSFLSRTPNTTKRPSCPRCKARRLERRASTFAAISRGGSSDGDSDAEGPGGLEGLDDARLEQAMGELAREAESIPDDDPRQMAGLMRKLYERTGLELGPGMEEAMRRLEAGEDPDAIEAEMGDALDAEEAPLAGAPRGERLRGLRRRITALRRDDTLYEL